VVPLPAPSRLGPRLRRQMALVGLVLRGARDRADVAMANGMPGLVPASAAKRPRLRAAFVELAPGLTFAGADAPQGIEHQHWSPMLAPKAAPGPL